MPLTKPVAVVKFVVDNKKCAGTGKGWPTMTLQERLKADLKTAMKAKDKTSLRGIRAIKSALLLQKTDGSGKVLDEAGEIALLQKLVKSRQDSLDIYTKQNREDLATTEREEIEVISRYLPAQLSEEELAALVEAVIAKTGASSMRDMGKVMGLANKEAAGRADGKTIAAMVKQKLG
jgi:uncharacterized protein YqeY